MSTGTKQAAFTPGYTPGEEIANSVTHGAGLLLAVAALVILTVTATLRGDVWTVVSSVVFGTTLVLLYGASTLYHAVRGRRLKALLQVFDHAAIFLLIAGTYTPFSLVSLRGPWGWSLFGVVWGLAAVGIVSQMTALRRWKKASLALYILMGWVVIVAVKPLVAALSPGGLALLAAGGLAYMVGVVFYVWKRLPYHHAVWHGFVLAGSTLHFLAVLLYVIPGSSTAP